LSEDGGAPGSLSGVTNASVFGNQDSVVVAADSRVVVLKKDSRLWLVHANVEETRPPKKTIEVRPGIFMVLNYEYLMWTGSK
jgi:hypothetical protein